MNFFKTLIGHVETWLKSGKPQADLAKVDAVLIQVANLFPKALQAVEEIAALVPTSKPITAVIAAAEKYGVPVVAEIASAPTPAQVNSILHQTAVAALTANLDATQAAAATHILDSAVQLAYTVTQAPNTTAPTPAS
jgi:hypothetical protein